MVATWQSAARSTTARPAGGAPRTAAQALPLKLPPAALPTHRLLRVLWQGRCGTTFEALDLAAQTAVAVTLADPEVAANPARTEAWVRTARRLARIGHPVLRRPRRMAGHGGRPLCIADLPAGISLAEQIRGGRLGTRAALRIAAAVADALAALHAAGLVHGQLRANAIFLDDRGRPTVDGVDLDQTHAAGAGAAADVAALRQLTFEMLTGRHPTADEPPDEPRGPRQRLAAVGRWAPHLRRGLRQWCAAVCDPADLSRPQTAAELAAELRRLAAAHRPARAGVLGLERTLLRHRVPLAGAAAALLGGILGLAFSALRPGVLELEVRPADAVVRIDGAVRHPTGGRVVADLADGWHWVRIESPGWQKAAAPVQIDRGDRQRLSVSLLPETGSLRLDTAATAGPGTLELRGPDGRRWAAGNFTSADGLPVGRYEGWLAAANYEPAIVRFDISARQAAVLRPTLRPLPQRTALLPGNQPQFAAGGRGVLALVSGRRLSAVDPMGKTLWTMDLPAACAAPVQVCDPAASGAERLLVGLENGVLLCLDALRGTTVFKAVLGGAVRAIAARADLSGDNLLDVIAGTSSGDVFALGGDDGRILWQRKLAVAGAWKDCTIAGSFSVGGPTDDAEVIVTTARPAGAAALTGRGGKLLWKQRVEGRFDAAWQCTVVPGPDGRGRQVVLVAPDGAAQALRAGDGQVQWKLPAGRLTPAAPVVGFRDEPRREPVLWTLDGGRLSILDPASGSLTAGPWQAALEADWLGPLPGGNALCVVAGTRGVVLDAATQRTQWTFAADRPIRACRGVGQDGSTLVLLCDDRAILIEAPGGRADDTRSTPLAPSPTWQRIESAILSPSRP